jgi:uncharacterized membrane protein YcaP (DUF421 family)
MMEKLFDWNRILFNELPAAFLLEVIMRSVIMFVVILVTLRASGKRGMKQLSIFELVLIIGLGSAAGDPMFYEDVGILPALTVFLVIILLYVGITRLTDRFSWFERVMEGEPVYVIQGGKILLDGLNRTGLSREELFGALRLSNVEHLGQVKTVLIETSGDVSILFFPDDEVKPGLPIYPAQQQVASKETLDSCCSQCGEVQVYSALANICRFCKCDKWVRPLATKRIS